MQTEPRYTSGPTPLPCAAAIDALQSLGVSHRTAVDTLKVAVNRGAAADLYHGGKRYRVEWRFTGAHWDFRHPCHDIRQFEYTIRET